MSACLMAMMTSNENKFVYLTFPPPCRGRAEEGVEVPELLQLLPPSRPSPLEGEGVLCCLFDTVVEHLLAQGVAVDAQHLRSLGLIATHLLQHHLQ